MFAIAADLGNIFKCVAVLMHTDSLRSSVNADPRVSRSLAGYPVLVGDHVKKNSAGYPLTLCSHVATLNKQLIHELVDQGSQEVLRPYSTPARWVGQLARSLSWKKLLQYEFAKTNHINVNENLAYRSLLKHVSKCTPHSRFIALLDSRVAIGCNAKGGPVVSNLIFTWLRRCLIFWVAIFILT